ESKCGQIPDFEDGAVGELTLYREVPLHAVASALIGVDTGGLDLHRSDDVRAERIQGTVLRNEVIATERLRNIVGKTRRQPEQRIGVIVGVEHPAAHLYDRLQRGGPDNSQARRKIVAVRVGAPLRIAALTTHEQCRVVKARLL